MEEGFSRPGESDKAVDHQEYWTLRLIDWTGSYDPCFVVQQCRGRWSDIDRQFMFEDKETDRFPLLIDAEERYEARRRELVRKGFVHSDMDF